MRRDVRKYLEDIQQCISELEEIVADETLESYRADFRLRRIAEREFIIIAEALSRISQLSADLHARVDDVKKIANFRNVIVHDYLYVDDAYVWKVIHISIPILKQQITRWAAEIDSGSK